MCRGNRHCCCNHRPGTVVAWRRALVWRAIGEPSVHSGDVPYRNSLVRAIRTGRRHRCLRRSLGRAAIRTVHDSPRKHRIAGLERARREAARRVVNRRACVPSRDPQRAEAATADRFRDAPSRVHDWRRFAGDHDDVIAADWAPGGTELAVVRRAQVEYPLGTRIYGRHAFSELRISPDGQRLALVEGPTIVVLIVLVARLLSSGWGDLTSLAWSPSGDEIWFTANRFLPRNDLTTWALRAVSMDGHERVIFPTSATVLRIHDVFNDGRILMSTQYARMGCSCLHSGIDGRETLVAHGSGRSLRGPAGHCC